MLGTYADALVAISAASASPSVIGVVTGTTTVIVTAAGLWLGSFTRTGQDPISSFYSDGASAWLVGD